MVWVPVKTAFRRQGYQIFSCTFWGIEKLSMRVGLLTPCCFFYISQVIWITALYFSSALEVVSILTFSVPYRNRHWNRFWVLKCLMLNAFLSFQVSVVCKLEGIRVTTEVMVHLCSSHIKNSTDPSDVRGSYALQSKKSNYRETSIKRTLSRVPKNVLYFPL